MNLITAKQARARTDGVDRSVLDSFIEHIDCLIKMAVSIGGKHMDSITVRVYPKELCNNIHLVTDVLDQAGYQYEYQYDNKDTKSYVDLQAEKPNNDEHKSVKLTIKW